jgi:hypothetical protein
MACGGVTEPSVPNIVPAGESDPAWANIGKTCSPSSAVAIVPANKRDSLPPLTHGPTRSSDDDWADAARSIPGGWGGLFVENGTPTIFLVDPSKRAAAIAAMRGRGIGSPLDLSQTRVKPGRWDFAQLADWYRYFNLYMFTIPGLRSGDINEVRNRIEFDVTDGTARSAFESLFAHMDLPCYLVAIKTQDS